MQYEIQEILVDSNDIPEKGKQKIAIAHKSEYQHAVTLDRQNKKKKRGRNSHETKVRETLQKNKAVIF